ncbi:MAG: hypothetical protein Q9P44_17000 [Anaerolineae bacterium]|nr:hypothetical protein [Anaerolineae bacterium]
MKSHIANRLFICLSLAFLFTFPVWAQDDTGGDVLIDLAYINRVTVNDDLTIEIVGELGDACTELGDITQEIAGTTITISVFTTRPADAMCAMQLQTFETTISLEASQFTTGENLLIINGNEYTIIIPDIAPTSDNSDCPQDSSTLRLYRNDLARYCFLYPAEFIVDVIDETTTVIAASTTGMASSVELVISTESAAERTLETIESQRQADAPQDALNFEITTIGGQAAIVTEDILGRIPNRTLITIYDGTVYTFMIFPIDTETFADETVLANHLWDSLMASFVFIADAAPTVSPSTLSCDDLIAAEGQAKFENNNFCFLYLDSYTPIGNDTLVLLSGSELFGDRGITFVVEVFPANNTISLADLQVDIAATYPEQSLAFEATTLGNIEAITTDSIVLRLVGSRQLYTLWHDNIIVVQIHPLDATYADATDAINELWALVQESWIFKAE